MDMITLAMAKNYTNSQRLGYVEGGEVLTFDGDTTGKTLVTLGNLYYVKLSDKPHDLTKLVHLGQAYDPELAEQQGIPPYMEITKEMYTVESNADASMVTSDDIIMIVSYSRKVEGVVFDVGVYAILMPYDNKFGAWISYIEFEETIHPIDPKFIPGAVLPVVELTTPLAFEMANNATITTELSAEDSAKLNELAQDTPIICKCPLAQDGATQLNVTTVMGIYGAADNFACVGTISYFTITLAYEAGKWVGMVTFKM